MLRQVYSVACARIPLSYLRQIGVPYEYYGEGGSEHIEEKSRWLGKYLNLAGYRSGFISSWSGDDVQFGEKVTGFSKIF